MGKSGKAKGKVIFPYLTCGMPYGKELTLFSKLFDLEK